MATYLNQVATANPDNEVHTLFTALVPTYLPNDRDKRLFARMSARAQIQRRYSVLDFRYGRDDFDRGGHFRRGKFPSTAERMRLFETEAPALGEKAARKLTGADLAGSVTHLVVTTCTGLTAPGLDVELAERLGLDPGVERTMLNFMGCQAAINGLRLADTIVTADPRAVVLMVNLELCTLHIQETGDLQKALSFMLWGDGCAASLVSAAPRGARLEGFESVVLEESHDLMTWHIRDRGFDMYLSGDVPLAITRTLPNLMEAILPDDWADTVSLWAIHPGGRSILDAVEDGLGLAQGTLNHSRQVLRQYGNMSSPSVMFVVEALMGAAAPEDRGLAMAFGPGLSVETFRFRAV